MHRSTTVSRLCWLYQTFRILVLYQNLKCTENAPGSGSGDRIGRISQCLPVRLLTTARWIAEVVYVEHLTFGEIHESET